MKHQLNLTVTPSGQVDCVLYTLTRTGRLPKTGHRFAIFPDWSAYLKAVDPSIDVRIVVRAEGK